MCKHVHPTHYPPTLWFVNQVTWAYIIFIRVFVYNKERQYHAGDYDVMEKENKKDCIML